MSLGPNTWRSALVVTALLLGACSSTTPSHTAAPSAIHTMPDGAVMSGKSMGDMASGAEPSQAAKMVCASEVAADIVRILGLSSMPKHSSTWAAQIFSCTYELPEGQLILSVNDAADAKTGNAYFASLKAKAGNPKPYTGMIGLGLPSYSTPDGKAVFLKDGKTLQVDASGLPARVGHKNKMTSADLAYAVAAAIVACWSEKP